MPNPLPLSDTHCAMLDGHPDLLARSPRDVQDEVAEWRDRENARIQAVARQAQHIEAPQAQINNLTLREDRIARIERVSDRLSAVIVIASALVLAACVARIMGGW